MGRYGEGGHVGIWDGGDGEGEVVRSGQCGWERKWTPGRSGMGMLEKRARSERVLVVAGGREEHLAGLGSPERRDRSEHVFGVVGRGGGAWLVWDHLNDEFAPSTSLGWCGEWGGSHPIKILSA